MALPISQHELAQRIREAQELVTIGALYTHYKNPSHEYVVKDVCILESTEEVAIVYQAQYGEQLSFIRTLKNWNEPVAVDGELVPRFTKKV